MSDKKYTLNDGYASIDELLSINGVKQRHMVDAMKLEDKKERAETVDEVKADITAHKETTNIAKSKFISEMKTGLGNDIKKNPNGIKFIQKPWHVRLGLFFKKIFTKF